MYPAELKEISVSIANAIKMVAPSRKTLLGALDIDPNELQNRANQIAKIVKQVYANGDAEMQRILPSKVSLNITDLFDPSISRKNISTMAI